MFLGCEAFEAETEKCRLVKGKNQKDQKQINTNHTFHYSLKTRDIGLSYAADLHHSTMMATNYQMLCLIR